MGFEAGHAKAGGRKKGSQNKTTRDVQVFVDRVFAKIDPIEKLEALLGSESEKVQAGVLLRLLEYRFGKPRESMELSGGFSYTETITRMRAQRLAEADYTINRYLGTTPALSGQVNAQSSGEPDKPNGHTDPAMPVPAEDGKTVHQIAAELVGAPDQTAETQVRRIRVEL
jgi:hypothetical protein